MSFIPDPLRRWFPESPGSTLSRGRPIISTGAGIIGRAAEHIGELFDGQGVRTYAAFISYSHSDMKTARWLHKAIENYRIPRQLIGTAGEFGPVPPRLRPIFRDEDELAGAAQLGPKLHGALAASRALIVICSPAAARSHWVATEIATFKATNPGQPVFAVIASGNPGASAEPCFPEPLLFERAEYGSYDRSRPLEPLAPDLQKLERKIVKLKLIAGLIGVPYSALYSRELRRKRIITAALSTFAVVLIAVLSTLTVAAVSYARMAVKERNAAIAAKDLAERRMWLAQQAREQILNFAADTSNCPPNRK